MTDFALFSLSCSSRTCEFMHGRAKTFSQQVMESIIDDICSGISDVAFRTAQPIGGLSCSICFMYVEVTLLTLDTTAAQLSRSMDRYFDSSRLC